MNDGKPPDLDREHISFWTPGTDKGATLGLLVKDTNEKLLRVELWVPHGVALLILGWHGGSGYHQSTGRQPRFHAYVRVNGTQDPDPSKRGKRAFTARYAWAQLARPGFLLDDLIRQAIDTKKLLDLEKRFQMERHAQTPWAPEMDSAVYVLCRDGNDFGQKQEGHDSGSESD